MNPELNREYPEPGEAKLIEEMIKVAVERMKTQQGPAMAFTRPGGASAVATSARHVERHSPRQRGQLILDSNTVVPPVMKSPFSVSKA
jgi:hypothetical protein